MSWFVCVVTVAPCSEDGVAPQYARLHLTRDTRRPNASGRFAQVPVDVARDLAGQPWHRFELLARGREEPLGRAEVVEQQALARRPHAGQVVEDRACHRSVAAPAVELDRETMRLVADSLEQVQRRAVTRQ